MRLIVADAAGAGWLRDKDGNDHQLAADSWAECDVRDTIFTGEGETAWVRYREDGRQVEVQPNSEYHIEYQNDDVIDVRAASPAVDELVAATEGMGTDEERIYRALGDRAGQRGGDRAGAGAVPRSHRAHPRRGARRRVERFGARPAKAYLR